MTWFDDMLNSEPKSEFGKWIEEVPWLTLFLICSLIALAGIILISFSIWSYLNY